MPRSKRKNTPTSGCRHLSFKPNMESARVMGDGASALYWMMAMGHRIEVTPNPKRLRYHIAGQRVYRRHIDQLVYHGVLDETELKGESTCTQPN